MRTTSTLDACAASIDGSSADPSLRVLARHGPVRRSSLQRWGWMLAILMGMGAMLAACTDRRALTEAAEAQHQGSTTPEVPADHELVPKLQPCHAEAAIAAMASAEPPRRAAGALCAARVGCDHLEVDPALNRLTTDSATAAEYVNRGPMFGSGDQHVRFPVSRYAAYAALSRGNACPSSRR